ncbi:MAG TPA: class I SAM-dependent methyltransferase [Polyangiales bacterium]|nr:class I SAM-dependent methyltransferase [Polyangiales bacterium]
MYAPSRRDWAAFDPASIPTKTYTPQLAFWLAALGTRPLRVVDVGCGAGGSTRRLVAQGFSVVGVDINEAAIMQLKAALADTAVELHVRDVASPDGLGLAATSFDAAVCQLVASVVGDARDRAALLRNIREVLRPGGLLFISFSGLSDDLNPEYASLYARDLAQTGEHGSYVSRAADGRELYRTHHFGREEILQLLSTQGFHNIQIDEQLEASSRRPDQHARFYYVTCTRP